MHPPTDTCVYVLLATTQETIVIHCESHGAHVRDLGFAPRLNDVLVAYSELTESA